MWINGNLSMGHRRVAAFGVLVTRFCFSSSDCEAFIPPSPPPFSANPAGATKRSIINAGSMQKVNQSQDFLLQIFN